MFLCLQECISVTGYSPELRVKFWDWGSAEYSVDILLKCNASCHIKEL